MSELGETGRSIATREEPRMELIHGLLNQLGLTANYTGFFYMSYAAALCEEQPDRLLQVTKYLYPEVAKRYKTNWKAVERNIRTAGSIIWRENRPLLEELARRPLAQKPRNAQLLAILVSALDVGRAFPAVAYDARHTFPAAAYDKTDTYLRSVCVHGQPTALLYDLSNAFAL